MMLVERDVSGCLDMASLNLATRAAGLGISTCDIVLIDSLKDVPGIRERREY